jgi:hypothetical protein
MINILRNAVDEVWGLFVDDQIFAGALVAWVIVMKLISHELGRTVSAPVLFGGLVILLVALTYRQAVKISRATAMKRKS